MLRANSDVHHLPTPANGDCSARIRQTNDAFRQGLPVLFDGYRLLLTANVSSLPAEQFNKLLCAVREFADFNPDNDPYGDHDFGSVEHHAIRYFWKIDAYDRSMECGSPDPTDPSVTTRVLTIMRADEY